MGMMRLSLHPPLLLASPGGAPASETLRRCLHASLWLAVELEAWGSVRRQGHLQLVREEAGGDWREVDLARYPMRRAGGEGSGGVALERVEEELSRMLAGRSLRLFRIPTLGLVSEIGEGREDFRRRATGLLRPEVERRAGEISSRQLPRLPWRRRAAERRRDAETTALATELAVLAGSIESTELDDLRRFVRRAEAGELLVADGIRLAPPRHRALML